MGNGRVDHFLPLSQAEPFDGKAVRGDKEALFTRHWVWPECAPGAVWPFVHLGQAGQLWRNPRAGVREAMPDHGVF